MTTDDRSPYPVTEDPSVGALAPGAPGTPSTNADADAVAVEQARQQLAEADQRRTSAPRASLPSAFITFAILCAVGSMSTIGLHLVSLLPPTPGFDPMLAVLLTAFAWIPVAILPAVLVRDTWRRGFTRRWVLMMFLWSVLWIVGVLVSESRAALVVAPLFLVLFSVALAMELAARKAGGQTGSVPLADAGDQSPIGGRR